MVPIPPGLGSGPVSPPWGAEQLPHWSPTVQFGSPQIFLLEAGRLHLSARQPPPGSEPRPRTSLKALGLRPRPLGPAYRLAGWSPAAGSFAPLVPLKGSAHGLTGPPVPSARRELAPFARSICWDSHLLFLLSKSPSPPGLPGKLPKCPLRLSQHALRQAP